MQNQPRYLIPFLFSDSNTEKKLHPSSQSLNYVLLIVACNVIHNLISSILFLYFPMSYEPIYGKVLEGFFVFLFIWAVLKVPFGKWRFFANILVFINISLFIYWNFIHEN